MRTIKFRAWDGLNKKFTYWTMNDLCTYAEKDEKPSALDDWQQDTGLLDRNGKEIWEGDIVKFGTVGGLGAYTPSWERKPGKVEYLNWSAQFKVIGENSGGWKFGYDIQEWEEDTNKMDCEIIGNIYENPELLTN